MSNNNVQASGGVGFFGLLGILFIGLKLAGVINWSWWLVLLPLYGPLLFLLLILFGILIVAGVCFGMAGILDHVEKKKRRK